MINAAGARKLHQEHQTQARMKARAQHWWHANFCDLCKARLELGLLSGGIMMAMQREQDSLDTMKGGLHGSAH